MKRTAHLLFRNFFLLFFSLLLSGLLLMGCTRIDIFEKDNPIPHYQWQYSLQPSFEFNIIDTTSSYKLYIVLRHLDAYRYNNIWLKIGSQSPGDTMRYQRFDLQLGSDDRGWEGTGMDDIWELRKSITNGPVKFNKAGNYKFSVTHIMRENPLQYIMSVGIRVEKL